MYQDDVSYKSAIYFWANLLVSGPNNAKGDDLRIGDAQNAGLDGAILVLSYVTLNTNIKKNADVNIFNAQLHFCMKHLIICISIYGRLS